MSCATCLVADDSTPAGKALSKACLLNLASCALKLQRHGDAVQYCGDVLAAEPDNIKALYRRGQVRGPLALRTPVVLPAFQFAVRRPCKSADPQTTSRRVGGAAGPGEGGKRGRTRRRRHLRQCARNALAHVSRVVLSCRRRCWSRGRQSKRCRAGKQAMLAPRCQRTITYAHNRKPLT